MGDDTDPRWQMANPDAGASRVVETAHPGDGEGVCSDCGAIGEPCTQQLAVLLAMAGQYAQAEHAGDTEVEGHECPNCGLFWGNTTATVGDGEWGTAYRGTGVA